MGVPKDILIKGKNPRGGGAEVATGTPREGTPLPKEKIHQIQKTTKMTQLYTNFAGINVAIGLNFETP